MCPLPHTAHYRSNVNAATLTTKEASILKSIGTIHRLPSQQAAYPTPALLPLQRRTLVTPTAESAVSTSTTPLQSFIPHSLSINPSNPCSLHTRTHTCMHVRSDGTDSTQTLLPSSGKLAPPYRNKSKGTTRHVTSAHSVLRVLPPRHT